MGAGPSRKRSEWGEAILPVSKKFWRHRKQIIDELIDLTKEAPIEILRECPSCLEDSLIVEGDFAGVCSNKDCKAVHLSCTP